MVEAKVTQKDAVTGGVYRFSAGPWNIHEGADPFGPAVREPFTFEEKIRFLKDLGFDGVQFHDDDAVPGLASMSTSEILARARQVKKLLDDAGLVAEFVAPRLWEAREFVDGAYTANDPKVRELAMNRSLTAVDIARELGTRNIVLWLAREGTYIREAKSSRRSVKYILDAINRMLEHDKEIRILIEPKPNEPMDHAYIPTIGHALALAYMSADPARVGGLIESAHTILAGLDPSDEMGYALAHGKLWSVHLNGQNGLKYDQDKSFGSDNLRVAFNQVRVLDENGYGRNGEFVGLDVKVMRTQPRDMSTKHLANSIRLFKYLLEKVRTLDRDLEQRLIATRDYEELDLYMNEHLLGVR
ncbi:MAG: TIM barrel protein [Firmicutes bacterium]|nr:TIM barrel protein [Bacillota bacterium]